MNILIVGEFSSFAKNLKAGFKALGHNVLIVYTGDGFKSIKCDNSDIVYNPSPEIRICGFRIPKSHLFLSIFENKRIQNIIGSAKYDLIIIINECFVSHLITEPGVSINFIENQKKKGAKVIFTSCGRDVPHRLYCHEMRYFKEKYPLGMTPPVTKEDICRFKKLMSCVDVVIPTGYDYLFPMKRFEEDMKLGLRVSSVVPLPIKIDDCQISTCVGRKINILHGIIRAQQKGSKYFLEALEYIKNKYFDRVNITIVERLPLDEYLRIFDECDILLDQNTSYCLGMNAEIGLMKGKVVLGGNELEEQLELGYCSPVINVIPNTGQIVGEIEALINNPEKIDAIKLESRRYAETYLNAVEIAKRYLSELEII